ncbi:MA1A2 mannosidase, partial [Atractosteus spatula]|nr:MA1A2 mannosidase [Atractosteus spatula]
MTNYTSSRDLTWDTGQGPKSAAKSWHMTAQRQHRLPTSSIGDAIGDKLRQEQGVPQGQKMRSNSLTLRAEETHIPAVENERLRPASGQRSPCGPVNDYSQAVATRRDVESQLRLTRHLVCDVSGTTPAISLSHSAHCTYSIFTPKRCYASMSRCGPLPLQQPGSPAQCACRAHVQRAVRSDGRVRYQTGLYRGAFMFAWGLGPRPAHLAMPALPDAAQTTPSPSTPPSSAGRGSRVASGHPLDLRLLLLVSQSPTPEPSAQPLQSPAAPPSLLFPQGYPGLPPSTPLLRSVPSFSTLGPQHPTREEEESLRNKIRADHERALEEAKEKLKKSREELRAEIQTEKNKVAQDLKKKDSKQLPPVPMPKLVGIHDGDPGDPDVKEKRDKIREGFESCYMKPHCLILAHLGKLLFSTGWLQYVLFSFMRNPSTAPLICHREELPPAVSNNALIEGGPSFVSCHFASFLSTCPSKASYLTFGSFSVAARSEKWKWPLRPLVSLCWGHTDPAMGHRDGKSLGTAAWAPLAAEL